MAHKITDECIACGSCEEECPTSAISEGDIFVIDPAKCNDCEGKLVGGKTHCEDVCPVDCCVKA